MIASLGMYDPPWVSRANDELWRAIADRLIDEGVPEVPETLDRERPLEAIWTDPNLLLAQTCGYPLVTSLAGRVQLVATPNYRTLGCGEGWYRSWIIVPAESRVTKLEQLRGLRAAINSPDSNSGMNVLRAEVAAISNGPRFFSSVTVTGGHMQTTEMIAGGGADVGAIDCVTWAHIGRGRPGLMSRLRILAATPPSPGLPLITAADTPPDLVAALRRALDGVATDPALESTRRQLFLDRFERLGAEQYQVIRDYESAAEALGYPALL